MVISGIFAKLDMTKAERLKDFQLYQTLKKKKGGKSFKSVQDNPEEGSRINQTHLSVLLTNARSIKDKLNELQLSSEYKILCVTGDSS